MKLSDEEGPASEATDSFFIIHYYISLTPSLPCLPHHHSKNDQQKRQSLKWLRLSPSSPEHVKGLVPKCTVLKADLL